MCAVTEKTVSLKNGPEDKKFSSRINILVRGIYVCVCVCVYICSTNSFSIGILTGVKRVKMYCHVQTTVAD